MIIPLFSICMEMGDLLNFSYTAGRLFAASAARAHFSLTAYVTAQL
jgi:hypothetical protein